MSEDTFRITAVLGSVVVLLGALYTGVAIFGNDIALTRVASYFGQMVPVVLGFAFLNRNSEKRNADAKDTNEKTTYLAGSLNGKLDTRFQDVKDTVRSEIQSAMQPPHPIPVDIVSTADTKNEA